MCRALPMYFAVPAAFCVCRSNTQAIIYVVDSCDVDRLPTSRDEFAAILEEEELREAAILVYANKQVRQPSMAGSRIDTQPGTFCACLFCDCLFLSGLLTIVLLFSQAGSVVLVWGWLWESLHQGTAGCTRTHIDWVLTYWTCPCSLLCRTCQGR